MNRSIFQNVINTTARTCTHTHTTIDGQIRRKVLARAAKQRIFKYMSINGYRKKKKTRRRIKHLARFHFVYPKRALFSFFIIILFYFFRSWFIADLATILHSGFCCYVWWVWASKCSAFIKVAVRSQSMMYVMDLHFQYS